jgi:hypothetical protein
VAATPPFTLLKRSMEPSGESVIAIALKCFSQVALPAAVGSGSASIIS